LIHWWRVKSDSGTLSAREIPKDASLNKVLMAQKAEAF
jgi:hypothetical protein